MQSTLRTSSWLAGLWALLAVVTPAGAQGVAAAAAPAATATPGTVPPPPQLASLPPAPAADAAAPAASASAAAAGKAGANPNRRVIEDDNVRVEETRVRGQLQRVTVHNKTTGKDYEVIVGPAGRDPSQKRDAAGNAAWSLFSF
jgi:hypothetical protein